MLTQSARWATTLWSGRRRRARARRSGSSFEYASFVPSPPSPAQPEHYDAARDYFQSQKKDISSDRLVPTASLLTRAPFPVLVVQQRVGDLVVVPIKSLHVVLNKGKSATMKVCPLCSTWSLSHYQLAWNTIPLSNIVPSMLYAESHNHLKKKPEVYQVETVAIRTASALAGRIGWLAEGEHLDPTLLAQATTLLPVRSTFDG